MNLNGTHFRRDSPRRRKLCRSRDTVLQPQDLLRVVCRREGRRELMKLLGLRRTEVKRVMLLGGGRTAALLAGRLNDRGVEVAIVEVQQERCEELAEFCLVPWCFMVT